MFDLPIKTKAAILVEQNKPLVIDNIFLPKELLVGQVLVKIKYSGICGSQLGEIKGVKGSDKYLPHLLGHEGFGEVLNIGPGVSTMKPGDRVILHWRRGKGIESIPPKYIWKNKELNAGWVTTFNEFAVVSENRCTVISKNIEEESAALFGCAITTGFGVIENNAKLKLGESLVVFGAGGIGLNMIQAASMVSAYPIIAFDVYDSRLALAKELGATHIVKCEIKQASNSIKNILGNRELDVFIDNTGIPEIIELGYKVIKPTGRLVLVGVPKLNSNISIFSLPLHFGKTIIGSHGGESNPDIDIPRYLNLLKIKKIDLKKIISKFLSLEDINEGISFMEKGETAGRVIIKM